MIEKLNKILQGLIERYSNSGTILKGNVVTNVVPTKTSVIISKFNLTKGVYIVSANVQFNTSDAAAGTVVSIYQTGLGTLSIVRSDMDGGGGNSLCAVVDLDEEVEIVLSAYHTHSSTVNTNTNKLTAVRIK